MKPLYEYANDYQKVIDDIENAEEITPELLETLESVSNDAKDKVKNVAAYIKNLEITSQNIHDAIDNMVSRELKIHKKIESLKNYLKYNMDMLQLKELKTPEFDVKLRYNNYALHIENNDLIPTDYMRQKVTINIDRKKIIDDLKNDVMIPGASFVKTCTVNIK